MAKRVLKHAILGLLRKQDMSGYDITAEFTKEISQFWSAKHSQIYTELKKLLDEKLIEQYIEISGVKLERKMYKLTEEGKKELAQWLMHPEQIPETEKDTFALKVYFIQYIPEEKILPLFQDQLDQREQKLSELKSRYQFIFAQREEKMGLAADELGHYLVLTKAISREESYVDWLKKSIWLIRQKR
ncbi:PadR family transcriptional regulator [Heyndrickxia coagulans]|uniref:PadR family transcriptional regulator n=1 Tax=Heyndrickxia coagulans TaxID=1398 RepID=UPI000E4EB149|nr:PadR family transcriptional regulator [Heyndrickxia coagulans]RGR98205.1 PadR family transcriptional regulator [Heyndrickxia coagulans]